MGSVRVSPARAVRAPSRSLARGLARTRHAVLVKAKDFALLTRARHLFILDIVTLAVASLVALSVWREALPNAASMAAMAWVIVSVIVSRMAVDVGLGLYRTSWRYASLGDMVRIVACVVIGGVAAFSAIALIGSRLLLDTSEIPGPAFWVVESALAFAVLATPRFAIRAASELRVSGREAVRRTRGLLYGAGWAGALVARWSRRDPAADLLPVGFLDDDPELAGRRELGLPVYGGLDTLASAARESRAKALLLCMPNLDGTALRPIVERALEAGLEVRTIGAASDLMEDHGDVSPRELRLEDLLRRPSTHRHASGVADLFERRTVLVTGAAGSIGSELARQALALRPAQLILVDRAESPLYLVQRELEEQLGRMRHGQDPQPATAVQVRLANVASRRAMRRLFDRERPDVVLHAAAYKHVPMLEENPSEAIQVNIGGTSSVLEAAAAAEVERFVLVSTDKAVKPSSVMGASKRVAEMLVSDAAWRLGRPYASVRFGNVLGSNGSVVPIFQDQLERGLPLTITDPSMTRYFMTIPEAAWLILDAAALATPGDLFVLDMGDPVRVLDLARDLARLAGRDPDRVAMKVTGLRRGEKLHEELFYDVEQVDPTEVPRVLRTRSTRPPADIGRVVETLIGLADGEHEAQAAASLHAFVRATVAQEEAASQRLHDPIPAGRSALVADARSSRPSRSVRRTVPDGLGRGVVAPPAASSG